MGIEGRGGQRKEAWIGESTQTLQGGGRIDQIHAARGPHHLKRKNGREKPRKIQLLKRMKWVRILDLTTGTEKKRETKPGSSQGKHSGDSKKGVEFRF